MVITPPRTVSIPTIRMNDSLDTVTALTGEVFYNNGFTLSAVESKKDSVGNSEAVSPMSYQFTTDQNYLLPLSKIEIYQSELKERPELGSPNCPKVFEGYLGTMKQGKETTYELIVNLFVLKKYQGNRLTRYCQNILGDHRCQVNLANVTYPVKIRTGFNRGLNGLDVINCPDLPDGSFTNGILRILTNQNFPSERKLVAQDYHIYTDEKKDSNNRLIYLSQIAEVSRVDPCDCQIIRGCDQTSSMCFGVYNNIENYRGWEFAPGNDRLFSNS